MSNDDRRSRAVLFSALLSFVASFFPASAVAQTSSTIVLWTSHVPPADVHGDWIQVADATAAGGATLQNPNRGRARIVPARVAPSDYFEIAFTAEAGVPTGCGCACTPPGITPRTTRCTCSSATQWTRPAPRWRESARHLHWNPCFRTAHLDHLLMNGAGPRPARDRPVRRCTLQPPALMSFASSGARTGPRSIRSF